MIKIMNHIILIGSSIVLSLIFIVIFVIFLNDRGSGIIWGAFIGVLIGHYLVSYFKLKFGFLTSFVKTFFYSIFVSAFAYLITNYVNYWYSGKLILSLIISWELSLVLVNKIKFLKK